jgi:CubicO group peptidase (beta-lactamase class C family)
MMMVHRILSISRYGLALAVLLLDGRAVSAIAPAPSTTAADTQGLGPQIRRFLEATYPADEPGAAVIVVRDGEVVFRDAFGMADLELGVALRPDMVFRLGSITKQFTGAAILLLQERGLLSVDDPITRFLPDYPVHGHAITIGHLLAHTSGIRSYTGIPGWMSTRIKSDMSVAELIDGFKNEPMDFAPGERFLYNNSRAMYCWAPSSRRPRARPMPRSSSRTSSSRSA